jgi:hypothetical protein
MCGKNSTQLDLIKFQRIYFLLTDFWATTTSDGLVLEKDGVSDKISVDCFSKTKYQCMEKQFKIQFNFPLEHSLHTIPLQASVTLHHSEPYYVVEAFRFAGTDNDRRSLLPAIQIKYVKNRDGKNVWVHKDSERESELSSTIGKVIEAHPEFTNE